VGWYAVVEVLAALFVCKVPRSQCACQARISHPTILPVIHYSHGVLIKPISDIVAFSNFSMTTGFSS